MSKSPFVISTVFSLFLATGVSRSENSPPDGWSGFGCFYDETFASTVVYARCEWLTFSYVYSGFEPMMPAPGWIQVGLSLRRNLDGADEVEVQLDGHPDFTLANYPYFGLTPNQLQRILGAKTVVFEARWWTLGRRAQDAPVKDIKRRERLALTPAHRQFLAALAKFGDGWSLPTHPWLIRSSIAYVIDMNAHMEPKFKEVQTMIDDSITSRSKSLEEYCIVAAEGDHPRRSPEVPHHIAVYRGGEPDQEAQARMFIHALVPHDGLPALQVHDALRVALNQQLQTVVLFTAGDVVIDNVSETIALLHQHTARLFVVWCGAEKSDPQGRSRLKEISESTGGTLLSAP
jgi:hypothetical protein